MVTGAARRFRTGWLTGGLHVLIVWLALEAESADAWPFALAAMAVVSFFAWMANFRRYRQVHDLPTSRGASCAQGYAELFGRSATIPDSPLTAPLSGVSCCWFSYCIERRGSDGKWKQEDSGESIARSHRTPLRALERGAPRFLLRSGHGLFPAFPLMTS